MSQPFCMAMVLCDSVYKDEMSGKHTLLGTFSTLAAKTIPIRGQRFSAYFAITDGQGKLPLRLVIVDSKSGFVDDAANHTIFSAALTIDIPDPLVIAEGVVSIKMDLPSVGVYHCQLFSGDDLLMSRRLHVVQRAKS